MTAPVILDLEEAAAFLRMTPEGLRRVACRGGVPGRKVGHRWLFSAEHLVRWIAEGYTDRRQAAEPSDSEVSQCLSTNAAKFGGFSSLTQMDAAYNEALAPRTGGRRKSFTIK